MGHSAQLHKDSLPEETRRRLSSLFNSMMQVLFSEQSSTLKIDILATPQVQQFIEQHTSMLDASFKEVKMSDIMRQRLQRSDYIFSGMKTFHELNEAFPSLLDENGNRKSFERFLNDVRKIDETYNSNYLHSEYNFVQASAEMAAKWERFMEDGDRYNLQYRTAGDNRVRPEHAELNRITLPITDAFWESYYPPNGWNCRCTVVQVRKSKYPVTPHDEAMALGEGALQKDSKGMFRFNSGKEGKTVPDYNPYTISKCSTCPIAKNNGGKENLIYDIPDNELCAACRIVRAMAKTNAKQTRKAAKFLQGKTIENTEFPHKVRITGQTLKEWTNQPHRLFSAKNRLLLNIENAFPLMRYMGTADNNKGIPRVVQSHLFEVTLQGQKSLVIIREYDWGEFVLHSISDSKELYKYIKKK